MILGVLCVLSGASTLVRAQFQMPDPKQMSGIPRPVTDLPDGSISVRLIRGELSNNIANYPVQLRVGSKTLTAKTDEAGRAQFDNVTPGATVTASADVDGEHLESQEFAAPPQGGIRLLLVATDPTKATAVPAASGQVVIAGNSRLLIEPGEEFLQLYYLLDIVNKASVPVNPTAPFAFDMPTGSSGCAPLEGASPLAKISGGHVSIEGPFPPGSTFLHVACNVPAASASLDLVQRFPAALEQLAVVARKVGDIRLASAQLATQQEMQAQGEAYIVATGPPVAAGQAVALTVSGLPHHSATPRWITLTIAMAIVLGGVWAATRTPEAPARTDERKRLVARRDKLFGDLIRLEQDHRNGRTDERRYATRREELFSALEHVYGALDGPEPAAA